jgi:transposase
VPDLPDIDELIKDLDPAAAAVVKVVYRAFHQLEKILGELREQFRVTTEKLEAENAELKRMLFGQKSERLVMPPVKREVARRAKAAETEAQKAARKAAAKKKREERKEARQNLPTVEEKIAVPEDDQHCGACGGAFRDLGEGLVTEQYEWVPAKIIRKRVVREKKVCRCGDTIVTAPPPRQVTEGAEYGPGLHAHVVVGKCADSLPFYRQAKQLSRAGVPISRSTLGDLFHRSAELLAPIHERLIEIVASSEHVNADETVLPVIAKEKCKRGYVWTFIADAMDAANRIITFVYSPSRAGETPMRILGKSKGKLQVDGYTGYNQVTTPEGRERAGCWAHERRYFFKALPTAPEAGEVMDLITDLYAVEWQAQEQGICGTDAHLLLRQTVSRPIVEKIEAWVGEHEPYTPPQSPLGAAIKYTQVEDKETKTKSMKKSLKVFLDDPKVGIDNNVSERALRIIALGRKNFLFAGNDAAAEHLAVLQTLVATCEANSVNPQSYLADVLIRIQTHPQSRIDELLPQNWKPPDRATAA